MHSETHAGRLWLLSNHDLIPDEGSGYSSPCLTPASLQSFFLPELDSGDILGEIMRQIDATALDLLAQDACEPDSAVGEQISREVTAGEELDRLLQTLQPTAELYRHDAPGFEAPPPRRRPPPQDPASPPRPPNAFILYRRHQQAHLRRTAPGIHLRVASKLIALWWKREPEPVKAHYRCEADEEKKLHALKYPGYRYKPKSGKERRVARTEPAGNRVMLPYMYGGMGPEVLWV